MVTCSRQTIQILPRHLGLNRSASDLKSSKSGGPTEVSQKMQGLVVQFTQKIALLRTQTMNNPKFQIQELNQQVCIPI